MTLDLRSRLVALRAQFPSKADTFEHCLVSLDAVAREKAALTSTVNDAMVQQVLRKAEEYEEDVEKLTSAWTDREELAEYEAMELLFLSSKLAGTAEVLPLAANLPESDLFSQAEGSPRWTKLTAVVTCVALSHPEEMEKGIEKIGKQMIYGNAVVSKGFECADQRTKEVVIGAGIMLYGLDKEKMRGQALKNYAKPRKESILALWNSVDSVLMAPLAMRGLVDVPVSRQIYLPRTVQPFLPQTGPLQGSSSEHRFSEEPAE